MFLIKIFYRREYTSLFLGFLIIVLEAFIRIVTIGLPAPVLEWFYHKSTKVFDSFGSPSNFSSPTEHALVESIRTATDFESLCSIFGYYPEEHIVQTKDGYMLGVHRLPNRKGERSGHGQKGRSVGKPVVYLHHGLLMNSEVWVCLTNEERALPFVLVEKGYDVWLGNNRGNKYSKKHTVHNPSSIPFWDFSIDDFCLYDIPDSIQYILDTTHAKTLSYVGFSQGTAQAFAALGVHPYLNEKVNLFVALAPAMRPKGLAAPIVDALMKASPSLVFLFFGRRSILSSVAMWQSILYPPIFVSVIDHALSWLFNWQGLNVTHSQKLAAYAHLYSFASVKSVVHWFQIMRSGEFSMYDDDVHGILYGRNFYHPAKFPTRNISTPILLLYGENDSLVDIHTMLSELPNHTVAKMISKHEHVDILWGNYVHINVFPEVLRALEQYSEKVSVDNARINTTETNFSYVTQNGIQEDMVTGQGDAGNQRDAAHKRVRESKLDL